MGFALYAVLVLLVYMGFAQLVKKKRLIKRIKKYLDSNLEIIRSSLGSSDMGGVAEFNGYKVIAINYKTNNLTFLTCKEDLNIVEGVKYLNNLHQKKIEKNLSSSGIIFFTKGNMSYVYVFVEGLEKVILIFVANKVSSVNEFNEAFKR